MKVTASFEKGELCFFLNEAPDPNCDNGFGAPVWLGEVVEPTTVRPCRSPPAYRRIPTAHPAPLPPNRSLAACTGGAASAATR